MRSFNEERKYQDRMEHGNSKFYFLFYINFLIFIEFSLVNLRDQINDETLSLRKNRHKQDFFARRNFFINDRSRHLICPFKLKGIPEEVLDKFRINDDDLDNSIQKTIEYLNSKELDDIKFGSFLLRIYFNKTINNESKFKRNNMKFEYHVDKFIDKGIINIIGKVLKTESNIDIISELTSSLINLTYFDTLKNGYEYIKEFITPTYYEIYYKLINIGDNEINGNLYNFLVNCIIECDEFAQNLFEEGNFIRLSLVKYLEPSSTIKIEDQDSRKANVSFFLSLSRLSKIFSEKQKITFYKIYVKLIETMHFDTGMFTDSLAGLKYLFSNDTSEEKVIFNMIKNNNYNIFDKMFLSVEEIFSNGLEFEDFDRAIYFISSIIIIFISLSEEKDVIILLQNTQLLKFIENFYNRIYLKSAKNKLLEILVKISHHWSNVVINMIKGHETFMVNIIKEILKDNNFDIRMKGTEIVFYMLSLNSLDINVELNNLGIIEQLITDNLMNDIDPECLKYILNGIYSFIISLKKLERPQWELEIINNLIKIGITNGLEYNLPRFNEMHNALINQIKNEINNILNGENSSEIGNSSIISEELKKHNSFNNPFISLENKSVFGNGISFGANDENIQNMSNSFSTKYS